MLPTSPQPLSGDIFKPRNVQMFFGGLFKTVQKCVLGPKSPNMVIRPQTPIFSKKKKNSFP